MRRLLPLTLAAVLLAPQPNHAGEPSSEHLAAVVRLRDGAGPIDVDGGHASPFTFDVDRDGAPDLLVGQYDGGKLRFYRNRGTDEAPEFEGWEYLIAGATGASVPVS